MKKKVNVFPLGPIYNIKCPILGTVFSSVLTVGDIGCCLQSRARVQEILEDGTLVNLNLGNYKEDNSHLMKSKPVEPVRVEPVKIKEIQEEKNKETLKEVMNNIREVAERAKATIVEEHTAEVSVEEALDTVIEEVVEEEVETTEEVVVEADCSEEETQVRKNKNKNKRK